MKQRMALGLGIVVLAAAVTAGASADVGGITQTRQPVAVDFTLPDVCAFPIRVHTEGWVITTPQGSVYKSTATLGNADFSRSLVQENHSVLHNLGGGGGVYADVYLERIVVPGSGLVYGTMGRAVFYFDEQGGFIGSEFFGHRDPYSTYTSVVCGYLAGLGG
jgi:hypothetical protein